VPRFLRSRTHGVIGRNELEEFIMEPSEWMTDYFDKQKSRNARLKISFKRNKTGILNALREANIASAELNYDGMGDSGCLESASFYSKDNKPTQTPECSVAIEVFEFGATLIERKSMPISEALETIAYDALEVHHPGWEINEGAYGILRIEVEEGTMTLCCSLRSTDYTETEIGGDE